MPDKFGGKLGLTTPWAREGLTREDRDDIEAAIPDGWQLGVSVDRNRAQWIFLDGGPRRGSQPPVAGVGHSMGERAACFYALRHWKLLRGTTYTTDAEGYVRSITDAE